MTDSNEIVTSDNQNMQTGAVINQQSSKEALAEGANQFAGDIVKLIDTDPDAVDDYLNESLANTANQSPNERLATYRLLFNEQVNEMERATLADGDDMLQLFEKNNEAFGDVYSTTWADVKIGIDKSIKKHTEAVGGHFATDKSELADPKRVAASNDAVEPDVKKTFGKVGENVKNISDWSEHQMTTSKGFKNNVERREYQKKVLKEAVATVSPGYQDKPVDLSTLIDEAVRKGAASKLIDIVKQARADGKSPEEVIAQMILKKRDQSSIEIIEELKNQADGINGVAQKGNAIIDHRYDESKEKIKRFFGNSEDYRRAMDPRAVPTTDDPKTDNFRRQSRQQDLQDLYLKQKRRLDDSKKDSSELLDFCGVVFGQSRQAVKEANKKITYMKEKAAEAKKA